MSVDHYWRRMPAAELAGRDPEELIELVPYWVDDGFREQQDAGRVACAVNTGDLIIALLYLGGADDDALGPVTSGPADWDDQWMVGTITADEVGLIAAALAGVPLRQWADSCHDDLAAVAKSLGFGRPFDDEWAARVVQDAEDLAALFIAAAVDREAIVTKIVA